MEFLPSLSRSSLGDGGDALKEPKIQREYRTFIESKLQRYWSQYPVASHLNSKSSNSQRDLQSNILILFRKLREGLMASKRVDDFAIEVYETSFHLSVLFRTPSQTTSIVNQLIPRGRGIYDAHAELSASASYETTPFLESSPKALARLSLEDSTSPRRERRLYRPPHVRRGQISHISTASKTTSPLHSERPKLELRPNIMSTALIAFFHILVHSYPSQSSYHSTLAYFLQQTQFSQEDDGIKDILKWLKAIASAVASRNYVRFERLSCSNEVDDVCRRLGSLTSRGIDSHYSDVEMKGLSLGCLVEDLRTNVRGTVWDILTVTYRELDTTGNADWLLQSLMLAPDPVAGKPQSPSSACQFADRWLEQKGETEVRRKEGSQGRWILWRRRI